ncbi:hypothetical protein VTO42DRAFT_8681 [Malbranchea cinnamomea]
MLYWGRCGALWQSNTPSSAKSAVPTVVWKGCEKLRYKRCGGGHTVVDRSTSFFFFSTRVCAPQTGGSVPMMASSIFSELSFCAVRRQQFSGLRNLFKRTILPCQ